MSESTNSAHTATPHTGQEHVDYSTLFWPTVNFSIYVAILVYFYRRHGAAALRNFSASVRSRIESVRAVLHESDREVRRAEARQIDVQSEVHAVIKELEIEGDKMAEAILAQAKTAAAQKELDIERQIQTEFASARAEVKSRIIANASIRARDILRTGITPEQDRTLRNEVLAMFAQ
jgi:F0F1-type ATP synthase membrane subunit b/b'